MIIKDSVEMTLIREACEVSDFSKRVFRIFQKLNGFFDPEFSDVVAEGKVVEVF